MASKNFSGILRDPLGTLANNDKYRFTHVSTTGEVIRGSTSYLTIGDDGVYNIDIEYGNVSIESYSELGKRWIAQGTTTINADTTATTLPALLNALVPASDELILQLEALLADAESAATSAVSNAAIATDAASSASTDAASASANATIATDAATSATASASSAASDAQVAVNAATSANTSATIAANAATSAESDATSAADSATTATQAAIDAQAASESANNAVDYSSAIWDSVSDVTTGAGIPSGVTAIHENMRRCLLLDDGTVNYYLDPDNSNLKADGSASVLTGEDGQVMVEIPKCYVKVSKVGNKVTWSLSSEPKFGYVLHPAFTKDGTLQYDNKLDMWYYVGVTQEVDYVYVGAYQASVYDVSGSEYIDGLNLDDNTSRVDAGADKLSSVAGKYPMVGLARTEFRSLANNRGTGWNEIDFWTHSLLQLLYTTEYRDLNSQSAVSQGVVNISGAYPASSELQTDSPHSVAGKSNAVGNQTGGVESSTRDVPWMSYRGVENFWGNCYVWADGVNILDQVYYVNNTGTFTDNTTANGYSQLGTQAPTDNGYIRNVQNNTLGFIPESVAGGSSNIAFSDYYYQSAGYRVMMWGGYAGSGELAGAFIMRGLSSSGDRTRFFGGRVVYK